MSARIALLTVLLSTGCSEKPSVHEDRGQTDPAPPQFVRIVFRLPGDDIGAPEHRAALDAIAAEIVASRAGNLVRTGYGMGSMEIVVAATSDASAESIKSIVGARYPRASYRIEPSQR